MILLPKGSSLQVLGEILWIGAVFGVGFICGILAVALW